MGCRHVSASRNRRARACAPRCVCAAISTSPAALIAPIQRELKSTLVFLRSRILKICRCRFVAFSCTSSGVSGGRVALRAARIADETGEVADQEDDFVAKILELAQLVDEDGVPEMQVGRRRIEARLHP